MAFEVNQKHAQMAVKCAKAVPTLPQNLVPPVYIYWYGSRKNGDYCKVLDCTTGKITEHADTITRRRYYNTHTYHPARELSAQVDANRRPLKDIAIVTPHGAILTYYAIYHKKYDCLEVGKAFMLTDRKAAIHKWNFSEYRAFIFHDDPVIYDQYGSRFFGARYDSKFYNTAAVYYLRGLGHSTSCNVRLFSSEVVKFTREPCSQPYSDGFYYPWHFSEWYKKLCPRKKSSRAMTLNSFELSEINWDIMGPKHPPRPVIGEPNIVDITTVVFFEKINDKYSVFRICTEDGKRSENYPYHRIETKRMFVDNKGKITVMQRVGERWDVSSEVASKMPSYIIPVNFEQMYEIKNLKYIKTILDEKVHSFKPDRYSGYTTENYEGCDNTLLLIANILRHPVLERIYKAGYKNLFAHLIADGEIANRIKWIFGVEESNQPLYEMLNTNKYIMSWMEKTNAFVFTDCRFFAHVAEVAGCDIRKLTKESFELLASGVFEFEKQGHDYRRFLFREEGYGGIARNRYNYYYYLDYARKVADVKVREITPEERLKMTRFCRENARNPQFLSVYQDLFQLYARLTRDNKPNIDLFSIDTWYSCERIHDTLTELVNQQNLEAQARYDAQARARLEEQKEAAAKLYPKRVEKYEYTDGVFSIIVPKSPVDLVAEGSALSHCVSTYGTRYATGGTDILFMRRNNALTKPYCTIEVRNGLVIQAHKYKNAWPLSGPDGLDCSRFLYKYFTLRGLHYERDILLNKSNNYGRSYDYGCWDDIIKED